MQFKEFINHNSLMLKNLFRKEILELDFSKAVESFNKQKFNQAYNILHELWKSSQSCNRKYFYQALLQTCAVFELIKQNKKDE
jgi:predicted metal-dependent hydrolase